MQSPALSAACPACPVETTLTLISDKWKVLILRDLMPGTKRFGELKKSIGTVTQKVLTAQLRQMEASGLLTRTVYAEVPPRGVHPHRPGAQPPACSGRHGSLGEKPTRKMPADAGVFWAVAFRPMMPTSSRAAKKHPGRGGWLFEDHNSQHHRTQGANSCPDGVRCPPWARSSPPGPRARRWQP